MGHKKTTSTRVAGKAAKALLRGTRREWLSNGIVVYKDKRRSKVSASIGTD